MYAMWHGIVNQILSFLELCSTHELALFSFRMPNTCWIIVYFRLFVVCFCPCLFNLSWRCCVPSGTLGHECIAGAALWSMGVFATFLCGWTLFSCLLCAFVMSWLLHCYLPHSFYCQFPSPYVRALLVHLCVP